MRPGATGRFITLEGGEGAGKSTQLARLKSWLEGRGRTVTVTREPGGSPGAEMIRKLLVEGSAERWDGITEALLHSAARREHLRSTVWPVLERGDWVVSDRFADSTLAYQGYGHGIERRILEQLYGIAVGAFRPDLTLILDLAPEAGLARAAGRAAGTGQGADRFEAEALDRTFVYSINLHQRRQLAIFELERRGVLPTWFSA